MELDHQSRADLPDPGLELNPLDRSKLQCLQILEWFQIHCKNDPVKFRGESESSLFQGLLDWLKLFNPEKDLVNNTWLKRVTNSQVFSLLIRKIKKEPEYAEYFCSVISQRKDGYSASSTLNVEKQDCVNGLEANDDEVEIVADSLFLENEDRAYRILGLKSQFKCLSCHKTNCDPTRVQVMSSTSPETLSKLFSLLHVNDNDDLDKQAKFNNILVLGSGFGSVTFCTHLFVRRPECKIISCEWNKKLSQLQCQVIQKHGMDRVTVLENCFLPDDPKIIACMDLVIGCERLLTAPVNVTQRETILKSLRKCMKAGARLVLYRKLADWLHLNDDEVNIGKDTIDLIAQFQDWLVLEHELNINDDEESLYYHVYKVL